MPEGETSFLTQKVAGAPLFAWAGGASVLVGGILWWRRRQQAATQAANSQNYGVPTAATSEELMAAGLYQPPQITYNLSQPPGGPPAPTMPPVGPPVSPPVETPPPDGGGPMPPVSQGPPSTDWSQYPPGAQMIQQLFFQGRTVDPAGITGWANTYNQNIQARIAAGENPTQAQQNALTTVGGYIQNAKIANGEVVGLGAGGNKGGSSHAGSSHGVATAGAGSPISNRMSNAHRSPAQPTHIVTPHGPSRVATRTIGPLSPRTRALNPQLRGRNTVHPGEAIRVS